VIIVAFMNAGDHHLISTRGGPAALAERLDTIIIATLDERHFRAVRPLTTETAFRLLPADR
jgi:hypothetical protein